MDELVLGLSWLCLMMQLTSVVLVGVLAWLYEREKQ